MRKRVYISRCIVLLFAILMAFIAGMLVKPKTLYDATIKNYEVYDCDYRVRLENKYEGKTNSISNEVRIDEADQKVFFEQLKEIKITRFYARVPDYFKNMKCSIAINIKLKSVDEFKGNPWCIYFFDKGRISAPGFYGLNSHFSFWDSGVVLSELMTNDIDRVEQLMDDYLGGD